MRTDFYTIFFNRRSIHVFSVLFIFILLLNSVSNSQEELKKKSLPEQREKYIKSRTPVWFTTDKLLQAKEQLKLKPNPKVRTPNDAALWNWDELGPGNIGGRIRAIVIHPTNTNTMWIGGVTGGIWKTTNGGSSWSSVNDFLPSLSVCALAMDPTNTNIMYAGTGEFSGSITTTNAGIFKSTDGGDTWTQLSATSGWNQITRIVHHPTSTGVLYASVFSLSYTMYKSTNGGSDWDTLDSATDNIRDITDIKIDPSNANTIIIGTAEGSSNVFISTTSGSTWVQQTTGGSMLPTNALRCELAFAPSNSDYIYASLDRNGGEIWRTTNGGTSWSLRSTGENYFMNGTADQGVYDNAIWVDPTDRNFILVGGINLYKSSDGGSSLSAISVNSDCVIGTTLHADQHVIVHHPNFDGSSNKTIFVGNDGGIKMTDDIYTVGTCGWNDLATDLAITQFYGGAVASDGSLLIGGSQDNGTVHKHSGDGFNDWDPISSLLAVDGDGGFCAVDPTDANTLYFEMQFLRIRRSDDGGATYWDQISGLTDANDPNNTNFIAPFVHDPNTSGRLVAGGTSIWRTTDKGNNWSSIRNPISSSPFCSAIDIATGNSSVIWVGYNGGALGKTTNTGSSWTSYSLPTSQPINITDIAINPTDEDEVVVTTNGPSGAKVYLTSNGGTTWQNRDASGSNPLPNVVVNTVRYHPTNINWLYIGTSLGVFASEDKGVHWSQSSRYSNNEGPANVDVQELFWEDDGYLYAATHGRGMWRCKIMTEVYVDINSTQVIETGSSGFPYKTLLGGYNAAGSGTTMYIEGGTYIEAPITLKKNIGKLNISNGPLLIK